MNKLSWLIYFAGIAESIFVVSFIGLLIIAFFSGMAAIYNEAEKDYKNFIKKDPFAFKYLFIFFVLIFTFVPNKNTILAIAASEIGENAITQFKDSKYLKALDAWIDAQLKSSGATK